jgi:hypothetical protein
MAPQTPERIESAPVVWPREADAHNISYEDASVTRPLAVPGALRGRPERRPSAPDNPPDFYPFSVSRFSEAAGLA